MARTIRPAGNLLATLIVALAVACGGSDPVPPPSPEQPASPDPCLIATGPPRDSREPIVAAVRPEDTAAIALRQPLPLIRLDCNGSARPAAAAAWSRDTTGRTWTFVLAPSVLQVTAAAAATEWRSRPSAATMLRQAGVASVTPLDARRLVVTLAWPAESVPALFAHPALAVVTDSSPILESGVVLYRPPSGDLRDAIDANADIVRSSDRGLVEYARARDTFAVQPLPWNRTYLLIIPQDREEFRALIPGDTAAFRAELARDAVSADARASEPPYWWNQLRYCPQGDVFPHPLPLSLTGAVVAPQGDPVARALAARMVALSGDPATATIGLPERLMPGALRGGSARAYVISVPRTPLLPCLEVASWPQGATAIPLVDTRMTAIVRKGVPPLTVDYDGTLRWAETR